MMVCFYKTRPNFAIPHHPNKAVVGHPCQSGLCPTVGIGENTLFELRQVD